MGDRGGRRSRDSRVALDAMSDRQAASNVLDTAVRVRTKSSRRKGISSRLPWCCERRDRANGVQKSRHPNAILTIQNNIVNAERRGKRQVLIRPSSKVVVKVLSVMQKHG
jgi:hypothetical protein